MHDTTFIYDLAFSLFFCAHLIPLAFFWAGCLCCTTCPTILSDTFTRADSTDIGGDWTETSGDWSIVSNKLSIATAPALVLCNTPVPSGDNFPKITVTVRGSTVGDKIRVVVNYTDDTAYDFAEVEIGAIGATYIRLFTRTGSVNTQHGGDRIITGKTAGDDITVVVCSDGTYLHAHADALLAQFLATRTTNTGRQVGLAVAAVTSSVTFDSFTFVKFDNTVFTCPSCTMGCSHCADSYSSSDYEVIIAGMANISPVQCTACASLNGTYIISAFTLSLPCAWSYSYGPSLCYSLSFLTISSYYIDYYFEAFSFPATDRAHWRKDYGAGPIDETTDGHGGCFVEDLVLPTYSGASTTEICDATGATCTVTAL